MKKLIYILILAGMFSFTRIKADEDRHLDAWYATYNHMYFQDRLPKTTVITRNLTDDRFMAQTFYENNFYHIAINPRYNESRKTEKLNLLHESCHIEVFIDKEEDEFDDHGEHWQRCMHRLADEKAFENLW